MADHSGDGAVDDFERERDRLFGIAYRMLGVVQDAEDVVQEAWLRLQGAGDVQTTAAFLTTVTTRLAIDRLRSAQRNRESYVGPWLPEPIVTDRDPAHIVELDDTVTLGFLHVLERLGPVDRAVFLLREVFDMPFSAIASSTGKSESACRQIAHRARDRIRSSPMASRIGMRAGRPALEAMLGALGAGDASTLARLVSDDVVVITDGGAEMHAARRPVVGVERAVRFLVNVSARLPTTSQAEIVEVNGSLGVVVHDGGRVTAVVEVESDGKLFSRIHVVTAPSKLAPATACLSEPATPPRR